MNARGDRELTGYAPQPRRAHLPTDRTIGPTMSGSERRPDHTQTSIVLAALVADVEAAADRLDAAVRIDALRAELRAMQGQWVREWLAAEEGRTWQDVADRFGVARPTAWQRFHEEGSG